MKFKKTTLLNGLRVITVPTKSPAVMVLVMVETGSNYETKEQNGLSHFLEHMCFKGTKKRPSAGIISKELDTLGATNNAFTGNEYTGYYAKASRKHFKKLTEIISDLYLNPTVPAKDLEIERGVILQEISMYEDLPQRKVWEVLYKLVYGDIPAGRPVIGPASNIKKFTRNEFVNYRNKHYVAGKTLFVVAGDVSEKDVVSEAKKYFSSLPRANKSPKLPTKDKQISPKLLIEKKKTDQTHMVMALRSFAANNKRLPVLNVIGGILGRGMSSRLFTRLRDQMGACYYVRAENDVYTDHGLFAISTGINASRAEEVTKVLVEECKRLTQELVSKEELDKVKEQRVGTLYMGLETADALAEFYADQEVLTHRLKNPTQIEKEIRKVTAKEVMKVAKEIFRDDKLNLAIVGDITNQAKIKKVLTFK